MPNSLSLLPNPTSVSHAWCSIEWHVELNRNSLGPAFQQNANAVEQAVSSLGQDECKRFAKKLKQTETIKIKYIALPNNGVDLDRDLVRIFRRTGLENFRECTPNVIEPSFGIGRIMYSVLEYVYWRRVGDAARGVLSLPLIAAPTKVLIVSLAAHADFAPIVRKLSLELRSLGISIRVDNSSVSIGKHYARNDELGTPLGITMDFDTFKDGTVTLRNHDTMEQIRSSQSEIVETLIKLLTGRGTMDAAFARLPPFQGQSMGE